MGEKLHPSFLQKSYLKITKNNRGITGKIYNVLLLNRIRPEIEKIL